MDRFISIKSLQETIDRLLDQIDKLTTRIEILENALDNNSNDYTPIPTPNRKLNYVEFTVPKDFTSLEYSFLDYDFGNEEG